MVTVSACSGILSHAYGEVKSKKTFKYMCCQIIN
jgi:hypothetical protein